MAIVTTPLGFQKPDGNELFRQGDNVISHNAQLAQDLIDDLLVAAVELHFDGGGPATIYAVEQEIDGGTV